jgi:hypothetical protein
METPVRWCERTVIDFRNAREPRYASSTNRVRKFLCFVGEHRKHKANRTTRVPHQLLHSTETATERTGKRKCEKLGYQIRVSTQGTLPVPTSPTRATRKKRS